MTQEQTSSAAPALLTRLNARGFRLVQAMDALAVVGILVGAMVVQFGWAWPTYSMSSYAASFAVFTLVFLLSFYFGGLYDREPRLGRPSVFPRAVRLTSVAGGVVAVGNLAATGVLNALGSQTERAGPLPTSVLVALLVLAPIVVAANRRFTSYNEQRLQGLPRALLVGTQREIDKALAHLDVEEAVEAKIVGTTDTVADLVQAVHRVGATDVILLAGRFLDQLPSGALRALDRQDVPIHQRVTSLETMYGLQRVRQIGGMPFVKLRAYAVPTSRLRLKRFTDLLWLVVLSPALLGGLLFTWIYTLAVAGGPVLYRQARVGVDGRHFPLVKFRTMRPDAEAVGGVQWAQKEDPRVIAACRWVRATRLDELPQVLNILRGEMSLVGPRPERPELTAQFEAEFPNYASRHEVPPGLTGLAQIHGRYHTDPEYKLGHDLQYLVNWSPILDFEIILRTVWVIVTRRV
ncbi:MAG: exopolysaccharide biosynthesis polyprenyl glycosylphosphotransferase [Glaciecola sp.]|jgi:exopolysaccharide biosynthesis polyprenyl glycosylphosphotransferase